MSPPSNIVVIGGGIAGVSTAYFLSISPALPSNAKITIIEGTKIAAGASGYSGGFLAKDWHGKATEDLAAMSYELHAQLAKEQGGADKWGYRTVDTLSIEFDATRKSKRESSVHWLPKGPIQRERSLGGHKTTAQVHPGLFTRHFAEQFLAKPRTELIIGRAHAVKMSEGGPQSVSVELSNGGKRDVEADAVVLAAGPWTGKLAKELLGEQIGTKIGVEGHRAHSIVLKTKENLSAHCLFTNMAMEDGSQGEPEVYCRPDGTTYICGAGDNEPLPPTAADVRPSTKQIERLHAQAHALSPVFSKDNADVHAEQACFLPMADRGRPLIGPVPGVRNVWVGSGLSCWGITQGPGTGKVLSEMILDGKAKSADVSMLLP